jgi:hypothetical protein
MNDDIKKKITDIVKKYLDSKYEKLKEHKKINILNSQLIETKNKIILINKKIKKNIFFIFLFTILVFTIFFTISFYVKKSKQKKEKKGLMIEKIKVEQEILQLSVSVFENLELNEITEKIFDDINYFDNEIKVDFGLNTKLLELLKIKNDVDVSCANAFNFVYKGYRVLLIEESSDHLASKYLVKSSPLEKVKFTTTEVPRIERNLKMYISVNEPRGLEFYMLKKNFLFAKKKIPMENKKFDKYFNFFRNDEQKFRIFFTVLTQENFVKLYNDDKFNSIKISMDKNTNLLFFKQNDNFKIFHSIITPFIRDEYEKKIIFNYIDGCIKIKKFLEIFDAISLYHSPFLQKNENIGSDDLDPREIEIHLNNCENGYLFANSDIKSLIKVYENKKNFIIKAISYTIRVEKIEVGSGEDKHDAYITYYDCYTKFSNCIVIDNENNKISKF